MAKYSKAELKKRAHSFVVAYHYGDPRCLPLVLKLSKKTAVDPNEVIHRIKAMANAAV